MISDVFPFFHCLVVDPRALGQVSVLPFADVGFGAPLRVRATLHAMAYSPTLCACRVRGVLGFQGVFMPFVHASVHNCSRGEFGEFGELMAFVCARA